jgi:hypothetical protein
LEKRPVVVDRVENVDRTEDAVKLVKEPTAVDSVEPIVVESVLRAIRVMLEKSPVVVEMLETVETRLAVLT